MYLQQTRRPGVDKLRNTVNCDCKERGKGGIRVGGGLGGGGGERGWGGGGEVEGGGGGRGGGAGGGGGGGECIKSVS